MSRAEIRAWKNRLSNGNMVLLALQTPEVK